MAVLTDKISIAKHQHIPLQASHVVVSPLEMIWLKLRVLRQLYNVIVSRSVPPLKAIRFIGEVRKKYQSIFGEPLLTKATKVSGRYYWRLAAPGFPSKASIKMHENEISRLLPDLSRTGLRTLLFAITKKCPLNCEHCFEWNNLNGEERLTTSDLIKIVHKYQDFVTTQVMFSGGEPMLRVNDIYEILSSARSGTDFWIITSGLGLDADRSQKLKAAGLTGVMVSLDHFEPSIHNQFRGNECAFDWATQAVVHANDAGLVTTLSLCATKNFISESNLHDYMNLAKDLGVSFVQLLEPRASGRYSGMDVELGVKEALLLEKTYLEYNSLSEYRDYPIVNYLGYHQRKVGCFGAGNRFFYIDMEGNAHICPFCPGKVSNALKNSVEDVISSMAKKECHSFNENVLL